MKFEMKSLSLLIFLLAITFANPLKNATIYIDFYGSPDIPSNCTPNVMNTLVCKIQNNQPFYFTVKGNDSMVLLSLNNSIDAPRSSYANVVGPGTYRFVLDQFEDVLSAHSFGWQPAVDNQTLIIELVLGNKFF